MASLAYHRTQKLLTQQQLARRAKVSRATIALTEAGRTLPSFIVIRKVCEVLGVDWSEVSEFEQSLRAKMVPPPAVEDLSEGGVERDG